MSLTAATLLNFPVFIIFKKFSLAVAIMKKGIWLIIIFRQYILEDNRLVDKMREHKLLSRYYVTGIVFLVVFLLYRPTIFGNVTTATALLLSIVLLFLKHKLVVTNKLVTVSFSVIIYFTYAILMEKIHTSVLYYDGFKAILSIVVILIFYNSFLKNSCYRIAFARSFIIMLVFFAASCLVTDLLTIFLRNSEKLMLFEYYQEASGYHLYIYFPFTPAYGRRQIGSFAFVRLTALFRECGIAQMFYIWALSEAPYYFKNNNIKIIRFLLMMGTGLCISTAGFINLVAYFSLDIVFNFAKTDKKNNRKKVIAAIFLVVVFILMQSIPDMSISGKNVISLGARISVYEEIFRLIKGEPLGLLFGYDVILEGSGLSLMQQVYMIGIVGTILYSMIPITCAKGCKNYKRFLLANIAGFITLLFSQPIWMAPIVILMWYLPYNEKHAIPIRTEYIKNGKAELMDYTIKKEF